MCILHSLLWDPWDCTPVAHSHALAIHTSCPGLPPFPVLLQLPHHASWNHLPNKPLASESLHQHLLWGELKLKQLLYEFSLCTHTTHLNKKTHQKNPTILTWIEIIKEYAIFSHQCGLHYPWFTCCLWLRLWVTLWLLYPWTRTHLEATAIPEENWALGRGSLL